MLVGSRMTRKLTVAGPEQPVAVARKLMLQIGVRHLPVVEKGKLVGIVSDRDLAAAAARDKRVGEVMNRKPVVVSPDTAVDEAAHLMQRMKFSALPVMEGRRLVGILTSADVLSAFVNLSGVSQPTYRIMLTAADGKNAETRIREVVERKRGTVKWLQGDRKRPAKFVLRLRTRRVDDIAAALEAAGFEVTAVVAPGRPRGT